MLPSDDLSLFTSHPNPAYITSCPVGHITINRKVYDFLSIMSFMVTPLEQVKHFSISSI